MRATPILRFVLSFAYLLAATIAGAAPETIFLNGKILTVDNDFSVHEAMTIDEGRIVALGTSEEMLATAGSGARTIDLEGATVLPGLIDSHVHITGAAMNEFHHPIPHMESIADVLEFIRSRAEVLEDGEWIFLRQVFITRLREQRYPTREELDQSAPNNPVNFATGPDNMLNTLALELAGIDRDFSVPEDETGHIERNEEGEPTGFLRGMRGRYIPMELPDAPPSEENTYDRVLELLRDYVATGLTTVADRNASAGVIERFSRMRAEDNLPLRLALYHNLSPSGPLDNVLERIRAIGGHPLRAADDPRLRLNGLKVFLDGGMLTGSALMREPWGVSEIYGITDPGYRGVLSIPRERLLALVRETVNEGLQFTAHSVGDGAVHLLLDVYREVGEELPIGRTRPNITHSNFMSLEAVQTAAEIGATMDIQPAWLFLDGATLLKQFGNERLRYFQPLQTIFREGAVAGGGTDHMQKIGSMRSVNPYNPFLGMWIAITRTMRWSDEHLHEEEALTREQAIRFYTANNAYILHMEDEIGTLEAGKRADFIILDRDILTCEIDEIPQIGVLSTWIDGERVHQK